MIKNKKDKLKLKNLDKQIFLTGDLISGKSLVSDSIVYGIYLYKNGEWIYIWSGYKVIAVYPENAELICKAMYNKSMRTKEVKEVDNIVQIGDKIFKITLLTTEGDIK